jgi:hypothetical protein
MKLHSVIFTLNCNFWFINPFVQVGHREGGSHMHFLHRDKDPGILGREEQHHNMVCKLFQGVPPIEQDQTF